MRLINTQSLLLEEFSFAENLQYAILSHRWEEEEVSFQDLQNLNLAQYKKGYSKVWHTCQLALSDGYQYAWIDTCCIDKSSSAELSEALNSMFRWYQLASVCYVYLSDVDSYPLDVNQFKASLWFTRGWTLQELLAPKRLGFFNSSWSLLGWKHELVHYIASCTGISDHALFSTNLLTYSISQRMSWAAKRKTTRVENRAYSLMGLFNVNMPMLYGEGPRAFVRLQEEIIKYSDDHTIFAWERLEDENTGLLAPSPDCFANIPILTSLDHGASPYSMTNQGLSIELELSPWGYDVYVARLACSSTSDDRRPGYASQSEPGWVGVYLQPHPGYGDYLQQSDKHGQYRRISVPSALHDLHIASQACNARDLNFRRCRVNVRQSNLVTSMTQLEYPSWNRELTYKFLSIPKASESWRFECDGMFDHVTGIAQLNGIPSDSTETTIRTRAWGRVIAFDMSWKDERMGMTVFGFDFDFHPVFVVTLIEKHLEICNEYHSTDKDLEDNVQKFCTEITCMERLGWDELYDADSTSKLSAMGLWAVRCNRIGGMNVTLSLPTTAIDSEPEQILRISLKFELGDSLRSPIWVVDFDGV